MLKLSRKTVLALEAVLDIAVNARPNPVQARDVTKRQGIPQRYLEQVMQQLVREGVLKGVRGPKGGYTLARERRRISVGHVVRVVSAMDAEEEDRPARGDLGAHIIGPMWEAAQTDLLQRLDSITMEDLCRQADELQLGRNTRPSTDFTI